MLYRKSGSIPGYVKTEGGYNAKNLIFKGEGDHGTGFLPG